MPTNTVPQPPSATDKAGLPRVVLATTAMLSFISFWRGAAIVLNDMGSSAFYAGAIAEQAIGKSAPWFILAIMLLAYAVRSIYIESCSMFVRGGVYRVVKEAMGDAGPILWSGPDVRLHPHRPHRRGLPRCKRSDGVDAGQIFCIGPDV